MLICEWWSLQFYTSAEKYIINFLIFFYGLSFHSSLDVVLKVLPDISFLQICISYSALFFWEIFFTVTITLINKIGERSSAWPEARLINFYTAEIYFLCTLSFCKEQVVAVQEKANELTINQWRQSGLITKVHICLSFL